MSVGLKTKLSVNQIYAVSRLISILIVMPIFGTFRVVLVGMPAFILTMYVSKYVALLSDLAAARPMKVVDRVRDADTSVRKSSASGSGNGLRSAA